MLRDKVHKTQRLARLKRDCRPTPVRCSASRWPGWCLPMRRSHRCSCSAGASRTSTCSYAFVLSAQCHLCRVACRQVERAVKGHLNTDMKESAFSTPAAPHAPGHKGLARAVYLSLSSAHLVDSFSMTSPGEVVAAKIRILPILPVPYPYII